MNEDEAAKTIRFSKINDPKSWDSDLDGSLAFTCKSPEDAQKAGAIYNSMVSQIDHLKADNARLREELKAAYETCAKMCEKFAMGIVSVTDIPNQMFFEMAKKIRALGGDDG